MLSFRYSETSFRINKARDGNKWKVFLKNRLSLISVSDTFRVGQKTSNQ